VITYGKCWKAFVSVGNELSIQRGGEARDLKETLAIGSNQNPFTRTDANIGKRPNIYKVAHHHK
jgi:hypothetical protein